MNQIPKDIVASKNRPEPRILLRFIRNLARRSEFGALVSAIIVFVTFSIWAELWLTPESIGSILVVATELGIVAVAVTLLMVSGEFDLSVGSVLGVSSILVPWLMVTLNAPAFIAILCAFAAAITIGSIHGLIVITARIPSFIVTLGGLLFWRGVVYIITDGFPVNVPRQDPLLKAFSYRFESGFDVSLFWFIGLAAFVTFLLMGTRFGNWIFASGGNEHAARSLGVPVDRVRWSLFVLTSSCACLAGIVQVGRFSSVDANRGLSLELEAIAACVIGGASLHGGVGSVIGTILGCLIVGMIRNGLALAGVANYYYQSVIGLLIVVAVIINQFAQRRAEKL